MDYLQPNWSAPNFIKAYTTVRSAWGERKPHHEENAGTYSNSNKEYVEESEKLENLLHLPEKPIWITQQHTAIAIEARPENREKIADASFTSTAKRVCVVLTADCLPVLITNQQGSQVAAVHAGWRGLAAGIVEETISRFTQNQGDKHEDILVWLGPAIGPQKFEVGKDVYDAFTHKHPESTLAFTPHSHGKWLANLYELAKIRLRLMGINQIYGGDYCTFSQEDLFFSYRRSKGKTGRMASLIWIDR
jgi:YfiH family protein